MTRQNDLDFIRSKKTFIGIACTFEIKNKSISVAKMDGSHDAW